MKSLAIVGASGHGLVVADTAEQCGWKMIHFYDDAWPAKDVNGVWAVRGSVSDLYDSSLDYDGVVVAIGSNAVRTQIQNQLHGLGATVISVKHPLAVISRYACIGEGCVVFAGAVVNAGAVIGNGVILNTSCSVDHDCVIGDFAHISPGARLAGNTTVGAGAWIGIGAAVRQGITIGCDVVVGANAAVVADVADGQCVVGVPARPKA